MDRSWERRGVVWPVLLVLAGAILLLDNIGRLEWSLWELLFRLWPAILIAAGIELLVPTRSAVGYFTALLLVMAVFVGSFVLLDATKSRTGAGSSFEEPMSDGGPTTLVLEPVIGALNLHAGAPKQSLLAGSISAEHEDEMSVDRTERAGSEVLRLSRDFAPRGWVVFPFNQEAWDLAVNSQVPLELEVDMAVGLMNLDLTELDLRRVDASIGVGEIRLQLPDASAEVTVDGGVGSLQIVLPEGASAQIRVSRGLASLDLPAGYQYADGIATSPAARSEAAQIEIRVNLGVGLISIREVGE